MKRIYNCDITNYNSYRIRSEVSLALFPENKKDIEDAITCYNNIIVVGGGNNIILSKNKYENTFLFIGENYANYQINNTRIITSSGMSMPMLSNIIADNALTGFEVFCDIPGSIGGGITMNAGAGDQFISNFIEEIEAYDINQQQFVHFSKEEAKFGYRESIFKNNPNLIITQASFAFERGNKDSILTTMASIKENREAKQPKEYPNAGSVFKRPDGYFVGTMIQELGLKGYTIGGAQISEKHAGFIVNKGHATGEDVINLMTYIKEKVKQHFGVTLKQEQIII